MSGYSPILELGDDPHPLTPREKVARQAAEAFHNGYLTYDECDETMRMRFDWIAEAFVGHPWMLTLDTDAPLPIRRIEHDGE